jgi:putative FmdB family regulatory protein
VPIFEYKCNSCGFVTEFLEKTASSQDHACNECGGRDLQKLLSSFAVGQSKSANHACKSCPGAEYSGGHCEGGVCPFGK